MSERSLKRARGREAKRADAAKRRRARRAALAAGGVAGATVLFAPAAQAATFTVDTNDDTTPDGCNVPDASADECTLREAVNAANDALGADTVTFAPSVTGQIELVEGQIAIDDALAIQGPGAGTLAVDANGNGRIFYLNTAGDAPVSISGLTLREGSVDAGFGLYPAGGAILGAPGAGPLAVADSVLSGNRAVFLSSGPDGTYSAGYGGAIALQDTDLTLTGTELSGNYAGGAGGAVIAGDAEVIVTGTRVDDNLLLLGQAGDQEQAVRRGGAGIATFYSDLSVSDSVITGNEMFTFGENATGGNGGGIAATGGIVETANAQIERNSAAKYGGGVFLGEGTEGGAGGDYASFADTSVTGNTAGKYGGGIHAATGDSPVTIASSAIDRNAALGGGGGISAGGGGFGGGSVYGLEISDSTLNGNVSGKYGGGAQLYAADASLERVTVAGNSAAVDGGGLAVETPQGPRARAADPGDAITVEATTISGNQSEDGGGIAAELYMRMTVTNSTLSGNEADGRGGGVFADSDGEGPAGELRIENSTVSENVAEAEGFDAAGASGPGGGVYRDFGSGDVVLSSTIVANSTGGDLGEDTGDGEGNTGAFVAGFSLIEDPAGAALTANPAGSNIIGSDPRLGPLAGNGGPTQTHLPAPSSPAVDAGTANGLTADQRGAPRTVDQATAGNANGSDGTDIGSVELAARDVSDCLGNPALRQTGGEGDDTLVGTDAPDFISGGGGEDEIGGLEADDCLFGEAGRDALTGDPGDDLLVGGDGPDLLNGTQGADRVKGSAGNDRLKGGGGDDRLNGGADRDVLAAGGGSDRLGGGGGDDKLRGAEAADSLRGGAGDDKLKGAGGDDKLRGGGGENRINCGPGDDVAFARAGDTVAANCETVK